MLKPNISQIIGIKFKIYVSINIKIKCRNNNFFIKKRI